MHPTGSIKLSGTLSRRRILDGRSPRVGMLAAHQAAKKVVLALYFHLAKKSGGMWWPGCWKICPGPLQKI
ncbi:MAG: hypothetical protein ABR985_17340 [Methanotrichaceae archaeon]